MISDLENIVISYLDPDSYKTLQQWNPQKYNKLKQIQEDYEKIIPDIIQHNIAETEIILKASIVILFEFADNYKITSVKKYEAMEWEFRDKIQRLIDDWLAFRFEEFWEEYEKLDISITVLRKTPTYILSKNLQLLYNSIWDKYNQFYKIYREYAKMIFKKISKPLPSITV